MFNIFSRARVSLSVDRVAVAPPPFQNPGFAPVGGVTCFVQPESNQFRLCMVQSINQSINVFISKNFYMYCKKLIQFGIGSM